MEEIELTFNAESVTKAFGQLLNSIDTLENRMTGMSKETKKSTKMMDLNFMGIAKRVGFLAGSIFGVQKLLAGMPEVGRTFNIVGDILSRNLLWPLRQEIIPLLQRLLDWARENRAGMVRFGNVLANIFRGIKNIVSGVIDVLRNLWTRLSSSIERVFGVTIRRMSDLANIAIFKLSAIFQFILISFEPVADFIGKTFEVLLGYVKNFTDGFAEGFGNLGPIISGFIEQISRLGRVFDRIIGKGGVLNGVFKTLGRVLGTVVKSTLKGVLFLFEKMVDGIEALIEGFNKINTLRKNYMQEAQVSRQQSSLPNNVVQFRPSTSTSRVNNNQSNTFNITVNESKNAKDTGEAIATSVRDKINMNRIRAGVQ